MRIIHTITLSAFITCGTFAQAPIAPVPPLPHTFSHSCDGADLLITVDPATHSVIIHQRISNGVDSFFSNSARDTGSLAQWIVNSRFLIDNVRHAISNDCAKEIAQKATTILFPPAPPQPPPPQPAPPVYPITGISLDNDTTHLYFQYNLGAPVETFTVRLTRDSVPVSEQTIAIPLQIITSNPSYNPPLQQPVLNISRNQWIDDPGTKGKYCLARINLINLKVDTIADVDVHIVIANGNASYHFISVEEPLSRSPNFFVGSFIKSLAGKAAPQDELLDLLVKVNLRQRNWNKRLAFAMMGADIGLKTDSAAVSLPLNEAVVSLNISLNRLRTGTHRIGFVGGGLKVFDHEAYFGGHVGLMEISGILQSSYIMAGYYYSPWLPVKRPDNNADSTFNKFRHNLYFEAAFNAFGDRAPKALQFIRVKFGLMLPIAVGSNKDGSIKGDNISPASKDFLYRLAVEVPIGGPIKF